MSTAKTQFDLIVLEKGQDERVIEAKGALQNCYWTIQETNSKILEITSEASFNLIPTELKVGLNQIWTKIKDCQAAINALAVKDLLE